MDTGKAKPLRVALTKITSDGAESVEGEPGGPITPVIGSKPDKKTQNIPLMDLIAQLNFRKRPKQRQETSEPER